MDNVASLLKAASRITRFVTDAVKLGYVAASLFFSLQTKLMSQMVGG